MAAPAYKPRYTYAEYLALEEAATEKHEYFQGSVIEMSGGTPEHSQVAVNIAGSLREALHPHPCIVYGSDLRVYIEAENYSTYGDVMVVCGELEFYQNYKDVITNPLLIVEVLSPSTRKFDRTDKFEFYRNLASFEHYLIVDPNRFYVEYHLKRGDENWLTYYYKQSHQTVKITLSQGTVELPLASIYDKVTFPTSSSPKLGKKRPRKI